MHSISTEQVCRWIDQYVEGDKKVFQELISHIDGRLRAIARRTMWRISSGGQRLCETDDLVQDLVVELLTRCESLSSSLRTVPPEERVTVFFGCSAQIIRDLLSKEAKKPLVRRSRSIQPTSPSAMEGASESNSPERVAMRAEFHEFINQLPEDLRAVADLRWYHGLTHAEVGSMLGIAEVTSRTRWARVRHQALTKFAESPFD
jgi:RNA polymerase sigma factor (sigma-70 family)